VTETQDSPLLADFPVGFERFHRRVFVNYQLNRAHALGYAHARELRDVAVSVRSPTDCVEAFTRLSQRAENEGRLRNATSYLRIAEFFTPPRSPSKMPTYERYRELFDRGFAAAGIVRHEVPYLNASLPAYLYPATGGPSRGTVLVHGGFDSLIEEFISIWHRIAMAGFDVIAFDGPGQGGARALAGLTFDHDWEQPVAAVLDYFGVASAALVGISMGGYWALRAAAFEPRIDRVVSWPPVYDWLLRAPAPLRSAARAMLRRRRFMSWSVRVRTRLVPTLRQVVDQALYIVDGDEPMDAVDWFLGMNPDHLNSGRVTQDVLLMCGEGDIFQPSKLTRAQAAALTSARSVTVRNFTAAEHADQHCQMGNLALACDVLTTWLRSNDVPSGNLRSGSG
jgi:pimeloyl-ACP methyl ester carboxylesterase